MRLSRSFALPKCGFSDSLSEGVSFLKVAIALRMLSGASERIGTEKTPS
jgi:hypothetical protein